MTERILGIDIETTGKGTPYQERIVAISINDGERVKVLTDNFERVVAVLEDPEVRKIGHNLSFDLKFLMHYRGAEPRNVWDTLIMERLLNNGLGLSNGLADVVARRCGEVLNKEVRSQFAQHSGPLTDEQEQYAKRDVQFLPAIYEQQLREIGQLGMGKVAGLENDLVPIVAHMELDGVGFDPQHWQVCLDWTAERMNWIETEIAEMDDLGVQYQRGLFDDDIKLSLNLNSSPQVLEVLQHIGIKVGSTNKKVLEDYKEKHPFVQRLIEWRHLDTLRSRGFPVDPLSGRIHCNWNQVEADTGRFSSSNPNLQNVRRPTKGEPNFRWCFPPAPGYRYIILDYSQQEPRILAQLCQDKKLMEVCQNTDVYTPFGEPFGVDRNTAKVCVLAVMYGTGPETLAYQLRTTPDKARKAIDDMYRAFPAIPHWKSQQYRQLLWQGYVETLYGRRRFNNVSRDGMTPGQEGFLKRIAANTPVQGSAADMFKLLMRRASTLLKTRHNPAGFDARFAILVHDEIVIEVREDQAEEMFAQVMPMAEEVGRLLCPDVRMPAEGKIADRWDK